MIGVDSSREMLAACRRRAEDEGVTELLDLRLGDLRAPPIDAPVPLVICPFRSYLHLADDGERVEALTAARAALAPGGAARLRRLRAQAGRHRGDPRPLARARARHLRARRMGRERPHAHPLRPRPLGRRDDGPLLDLARGMAAAPRGNRLHRRGLLRLVRPNAVPRRRGHGLRRQGCLNGHLAATESREEEDARRRRAEFDGADEISEAIASRRAGWADLRREQRTLDTRGPRF